MRTFRYCLQVALCLGAVGCAGVGQTYIESRPYVRASIDDANFEARNFSTVEGSIGIDPVTGAHIVAVKADRKAGWASVTKWIAVAFAFFGGS